MQIFSHTLHRLLFVPLLLYASAQSAIVAGAVINKADDDIAIATVTTTTDALASLTQPVLANTTNDSTLRILSLNGGGVRGIVEARILMHLEQLTGKSVSDMFHLIGGTSAGGMLATLLTTPKELGSTIPRYTAKEAFEIILQDTPNIFHQRSFAMEGFWKPKYRSKPYIKLLQQYFRNTSMYESTIPTVVFAYDTGTQKIEALSSWCSPMYKKVDAIAATSAAQVLFNPHTAHPLEYDYTRGFVDTHKQPAHTFTDGGIGANNPSTLLLGKGLSLFPNAQHIDLISVGTGSISAPLHHKDIHNTGLLRWLSHLPGIVGKSQESVNQDFLHNLLNLPSENGTLPNIRKGGIYSTINPPLELEHRQIDNYSKKNINSIIQLTDIYIHNNYALFENIANRLSEPKTALSSII